MRSTLVIAALLLAACDGKKTNTPKDDAAVPGEDAPVADDASVDAPPLAACMPMPGANVASRRIGTVVGAALLATSPPGDPRLFVIEQRGAIRIFKNEVLQPDPFIDLSPDAQGPVLAGGEQGLLGLAFHPQYQTNGLFFVYYTTRTPGNVLRDVISRCSVSANPDRANPTCTEVLSIPDFASNHNGGMIEFGKDGFLYIGTGDGGGANDTQNLSQNRSSLLGKMLRIDVDNKAPMKEYGIPATNPFATGGGAPEVYMIGLRNPWRWSFDRENGDMWIGDVGQNQIEEVTWIPAGQQAGANLGWSMYEGTNCFKAPCSPTGMTMPQDQRTHASGWLSVIGGVVYRGTCYPDLVGWYFYTDYGPGTLVKALPMGNGTLQIVNLTGQFTTSPASIYEDSRGELYETDTAGGVYRLEGRP